MFAPLSFLTPSIVITLVPAPSILAPILFKNCAIFIISISLAAFIIVVIPSAILAANIMLIVAPTEAKSKLILVPFKFLASKVYL